jgi:hypothetical protein
MLHFPWAFAEEIEIIEPFVAYYEAKKLGLSLGAMQLVLTRLEKNHYKFEAFSETTGIASVFSRNQIVERSFLIWQDQHFRPVQYWFDQSGRKNRQISVKFDWQTKSAEQNRNGTISKYPLENDGHDRMSYQIALMQELRQDHRQFNYSVMERNGFKEYMFKVLLEEEIDTSLGKMATLKLERLRKSNDNSKQRSTVFWCAKKLAFLPVRIQHTEKNGYVFIMNINKLDGILAERLSTARNKKN